jgi:hypothetical protein
MRIKCDSLYTECFEAVDNPGGGFTMYADDPRSYDNMQKISIDAEMEKTLLRWLAYRNKVELRPINETQ